MALPEEVSIPSGTPFTSRRQGGSTTVAKPLQGFGSAAVLEVVEDWRGSTCRAVYAVRFSAAVFVLHVFQKKALREVATPRHDMELTRERLKVAEQMAKELPR